MNPDFDDDFDDDFDYADKEYEYGDEWDWDKNDSSQYCKHGNFIGSWWGPDILCILCETE
jgi:hypothetical protein